AQYFIGEFDGTRFISDAADDQTLRVDYGNDFYAAQSWSDVPNERCIWIAWLNNWHYANLIPTSPWRGLFSIPRELHLRRYPEGLRLIQIPIEELKTLRQSLCDVENTEMDTANAQLTELDMDIATEIQVEFALGTAREFGIKICAGESEETVIGYDMQTQKIFLDRNHSGDSTFSEKFVGAHQASLLPEQGKIRMHIFVDTCSVEVFANDGKIVISDLIFPPSQNTHMEIYARDGAVQLNKVDVWKLVVEN
ncbi:MAG TPA: GH32 C-terminal domain-containing protein, partial [Anaerolineales bacterium]|nr:GH32 C-terminal domain-containing protein [Anaerolineales bacterium]